MITFVSVPRPRRNAGLSRVRLLSSAKTARSQLKSQSRTISCSPGTSGTTGGGGCCLRSPLRSCWCYLCCALGQRPALWTAPRQRTTTCWWMKWRNRYPRPFSTFVLGRWPVFISSFVVTDGALAAGGFRRPLPRLRGRLAVGRTIGVAGFWPNPIGSARQIDIGVVAG